VSVASPTFSQIKAQVTAIRHKLPQARVIGIRSQSRWNGPPEERDGDHTYLIRQCDSPLAMRLALRQKADGQFTKILLTPLAEQELGDDIMVRLAKRRLFPIDSWQIVRSLFQARTLDPRLTGHAWIADVLLESMPSEGYPPARGGFLDAETVWPLVLAQTIGLTAETPDLVALLRWSLDADSIRRYSQTLPEHQDRIIDWLTQQSGPVARVVLKCVGHTNAPDAIPVGLASGIVFHPQARGKLERAAGKLEERFLAGQSPDASVMRKWTAAATDVVRALRHTDHRVYRQVLQRTDEILLELGADNFAHLSDTSSLGFDQRLAQFGRLLSERIASADWSHSDALIVAKDSVRAHDQSLLEGRRIERIQMASRLLRWLGTHDVQVPAPPRSLSEAAADHLSNGGFVDWARLSLRAGDAVGELSEAYARLFAAVTRVREQQASQFARLLVDWTAADRRAGDLVPVEQFLEEIVAPLAAHRPVLLIVIDGMSVAVCRELLTDLARRDWIPLCEASRVQNRPGLATIPSVTEYARTSLLCGRLQRGAAADEQAGFAQHPALLAQCRAANPPVLFHKVSLQESQDAVLAKEVRETIQSSHRRIVGVVVNAVDDHLLKGDQIDTRWSHDEIRVLPALLYEARNAGRLVVLVSDHGHILDCQTDFRPADGGERWRTAIGEPAADEFLVRGRRVLVDGQELIAPWSERVRYGIKKNGYHGGLSPQEMIVPIVVLSNTDEPPTGWKEQPVDVPAWWDEPLVAPIADIPVPRLKPIKPRGGRLFELEETDETKQETAPTQTADAAPAWIRRLLASPVYQDQKRLAGRGLPPDEVLTRFLSELDNRGGKLTSVALARALAFPEVRLPGFLAKAQRLLNVDGYAVLNRDDASNTIELNRDLLLKQFDLV
jgi:hypothetical protein